MPKALASTKHFKVSQALRKHILSLSPGESLPTHRELRDRFGASQVTIDKALKRLHREGLIQRPAGTKRLVVGEFADPATLRVCLLRPGWPSLMFDAFVQVIAATGQERNWAFDIQSYRTMASVDVATIAETCDALLLLTTTEPIPDRLAQILAKPPIPVVLLQDHRPGLDAHVLAHDDRQMARSAARHLLDLGHERILMALPTLSTGPMRHALQGWREAMEAVGQPDLDALVFCADTPPHHDPRKHTYARFVQLLASPHEPFSAIYFANSACAQACIRALYESNISIPRDVSIVTSDALTDECEFMVPPVTALHVDPSRISTAIVAMIDKQFRAGPGGACQVLIDCHLVDRGSTAPFSGSLVKGPAPHAST